MNYTGMREDIREIFAEAQHRVQRSRGSLVREIGRTIGDAPRRDRSSRYASSRMPAIDVMPLHVGVSECPLCGGALQHREGNPRPIHIGVCSR